LNKHLPPHAPPRNISFDGEKLIEPKKFRPLPISNKMFFHILHSLMPMLSEPVDCASIATRNQSINPHETNVKIGS
jgi:hypothetical protein